MTPLMLLFTGSVYFLNGLGTLGRVEPKGTAALNLIVGVALTLVTFVLILSLPAPTSDSYPQEAIGMIGFPLFAFTFLYVGIQNYTGHDGAGFGWFCGWSVMVSVGLFLAHFLMFSDIASGLLWLVRSAVFASLFMTSILGWDHLTKLTGYFLILAGFTTCVIPASMMLLGVWSSHGSPFVWIMEIGSVAFFIIGAMKTTGSRQTIKD